jgi:hypothetical protein
MLDLRRGGDPLPNHIGRIYVLWRKDRVKRCAAIAVVGVSPERTEKIS